MAELRNSGFILGNATSAYTLTSAYTGTGAAISTVVPIASGYQVALDVAYTMGATETSNSIQLIVEFASPVTEDDNAVIASTEWYRQTAESVSGGTSTVTLKEYSFAATVAAGTYDRFHLSFPVDAKFMRISAKETGVTSNAGSATIKFVLTESQL